ncbi:FAD-dependent monooxygenase [Peterkaempfera sp. SMS 1(5)a]|uniref:FAD-dependent monooxygenase n=1 Tax=Peterkaempfera podocarpi TaxID=3232308 RepID=UPI00366E2F76
MSSETPHAVVVGAGIGGLTAAAALHRSGWSVTVLERAAAGEPAGAGIALAPNAQRALDTLGVGDRVRAMAAFQGPGSLRRPSGRRLTTTTGEEAAARFGGPVVVAHRADVVDLLAGLLPRGALYTGVPVTSVDPGDARRRASVTTAQGELRADLVVAADGIGSTVRSALFPGRPGPRPTGLTSWRAVVSVPGLPLEAHETWGRGLLWGTVPLLDGRVYCYATARAAPGGRATDERAELRRLFGSWHHPVPALIEAMPAGGVLRTDIRSMPVPLPAHHRGRVALLGDAAHAMTPNLGQGGCQAVEDAVVLARLAGPGGDIEAALAVYTAERLPRTTEVVRRSEQIARLTAWRSRPAVALRDATVAALGRLAPQLALRSLDGIADWRPPSGPDTTGPLPAHPPPR